VEEIASAIWQALLLPAGWALALWFPALAVAVSTGPVYRGDPSPSWWERVLQRVPLVVASFPLPDATGLSTNLAAPGSRWIAYASRYQAGAETTWRAHQALFLPARCLSALIGVLCILQVPFGAVLAQALPDVFALTAVAFLGLSPLVVTIQIERLRWRRRAPFEYRILQEAITFLRRLTTPRRKKQVSRTQALTELDDLLVVARNRYRYDAASASRDTADTYWRFALLGIEHDAVEERLNPGRWEDTTPSTWAKAYLEHLARILSGPSSRRDTPTPSALITQPRRSVYSADRASAEYLTIASGVALLAAAWIVVSNPDLAASVTQWPWSTAQSTLGVISTVAALAGSTYGLFQRSARSNAP